LQSRFAWQLRFCTSSSRFLIFLLIILYTVYLNFPQPPLSLNIVIFFIESELSVICPHYFNLQIVAKVNREYLDIIWLVTDAFILLNVHGIISLSLICFPLQPYSTAVKSVGHSSLTFVLVETSKSFMIFVKFRIAALLKLIPFLVSSLVGCHWWWELPKNCS